MVGGHAVSAVLATERKNEVSWRLGSWRLYCIFIRHEAAREGHVAGKGVGEKCRAQVKGKLRESLPSQVPHK